MPAKKRIALSWSSGKDSVWALHLLRASPDFEVVALITSFNAEANRVAMHGVRRELVELQAERTGLPLWPVLLPWPCTNAVYETTMREVWQRAIADNIHTIAFGDLYLREIREYRERQLAGTSLEPLIPLWDLPTEQLARDMIAGGIKARLTCIDPAKLDASFAGREFNHDLLADFPTGIDPCGENGEFHTFVHDAPVFTKPILVEPGEVVTRDGFVYADFKTSI